MLLRYLIFIALCLPGILPAQDPTFSQHYVNRALLNPALAGLDEGVSAIANYRNQWHRLSGGFQTYAATVETQFPRGFFSGGGFGGGLSVFKDREGAGPLNTFGGNLYVSRYQLVGKEKALHFGAAGGFVQKSVDYSRLTFSDQLDESDGLVNPVTAAPLTGGQSRAFNVEAGVAYRAGFGKHPEDNFFNGGMAFKHFLPADESLLGAEKAVLPMRTTLHAAFLHYSHVNTEVLTKIYIGICPYAQAEFQGGFAALNVGFYTTFNRLVMGGGWRLSNPNSKYNGGMTDGLIFNTGVELGNKEQRYWIGYSYDANFRGIHNGAGGGVHELSLRCNWFDAKLPRWMGGPGGGKKRPNTYKCPKPGGALGRFI